MVDLNSSTDISQWDTQQLVTFLAAAAEKGAIIYSKLSAPFSRSIASAIFLPTLLSSSRIILSKFFRKMHLMDMRTSTSS